MENIYLVFVTQSYFAVPKNYNLINDKITDEKLQNDINREAAKISALSSGEIDKYEYLTGQEILLNRTS